MSLVVAAQAVLVHERDAITIEDVVGVDPVVSLDDTFRKESLLYEFGHAPMVGWLTHGCDGLIDTRKAKSDFVFSRIGEELMIDELKYSGAGTAQVTEGFDAVHIQLDKLGAVHVVTDPEACRSDDLGRLLSNNHETVAAVADSLESRLA